MRNRKISAVLKQKSYVIAAVIMLAAAFGMTGIYYSRQNQKQEEQIAKVKEEQVKQAKAEDQKKEKEEQKRAEQEKEKKAAEAREENTEAVSGIIPPENSDFMDEPEVVSTVDTPVQPELHFDAAQDLGWPLQGNVIMSYSMDQTVYFATLDQYKYNPAVMIQAEVNTPVTSVAQGKVTDISTSQETGATMTVDLGDGYTAIYGQLKEIPKNTGEYVKAGEIVGYVSEPTKYFSVEGSNLYFELQKDGAPVNPMEYLQ